MVQKNDKESIGSLKISQEVIKSIASVAANEVEGVASVAQTNNVKDVFNIKKSLSSKSIKVNINNDMAVIDIYINVNDGVKIQAVSQKVQQKVKDEVQSMTGIAISKVNVHIVGIDFCLKDETTEEIAENNN